MLSFKLQIPET
ncbi:hypothetical protein MTR67_038978 [Solanum verrucosum]|nr:hypothetical protein MTR67_038978 [Solanum verrucosum]